MDDQDRMEIEGIIENLIQCPYFSERITNAVFDRIGCCYNAETQFTQRLQDCMPFPVYYELYDEEKDKHFQYESYIDVLRHIENQKKPFKEIVAYLSNGNTSIISPNKFCMMDTSDVIRDSDKVLDDTLKILQSLNLSTMPEHLREMVKKTLLSIYIEKNKDWNKDGQGKDEQTSEGEVPRTDKENNGDK